MTILLLALSAGVFVGLLRRRKAVLLQLVDRATSASIFILLFLLGIAVGADQEITGNLDRLGVEALVLSIGGTAGSIFLIYILYRELTR